MRLLIGNDLDDSIVHKRDVRAWAQRILWFARDHDVLLLMDDPDETFVRYVTSLTGVDASTLRIHVLPAGRFARRMFDHHRLLDEAFVAKIRPDLTDVREVFALWASPGVSAFLARLGMSHLWPGADFYAQNAVELLNSMGNFRAFATAAGVPVAEGLVCRTVEDAGLAMSRLLARHEAVMVKKAHGGAGAGNQVVSRVADLATAHAGSLFTHTLDPGQDAVEAFWAQRWDWASSAGRYPVVIERFVPDARSVYVEFHLDEAGVRLRELGELVFEERQLAKEVVPLRTLDEPVRGRLVDAAHRLAAYYHRLGHRGFLSADAVVGPDEFTFTEVNAQVTGSTHLYSVIAHQVVDVWRDPQRTVTQCVSAPDWKPVDLSGFLAATRHAECAYDPIERKGVIAVTPHIGSDTSGPVIFAVVHESPPELTETLRRLAGSLT